MRRIRQISWGWVGALLLCCGTVLGAPVLVGIVDTGADTNGTGLNVVQGWSFVGSVDGPGCAEIVTSHTRPGHGTKVAGVVGGPLGVAPGTPLLVVATGYEIEDMVRGINWVVDHGARVVLLPWGATQPDAALSNACWNAGRKNVVIVTAANPEGYTEYPSGWRFPNVLTATTPGRDVISLGIGGKVVFSSGTSFAAARVAGGVARLLAECHRGAVNQ